MDIRAKYIQFFRDKGHKIYDSMPLVPDDASLLFTNAGMVQFKDIFTGKIPTPKPPRATSSQLCIRAGGKHNDLENVGYTARHHTLFEMLGNFSFGDYFKKEAIAHAWEFVTRELGFDKNILYVTIHESDDEAYELWCEHIEPNRIKRMGDKDNFWQMGDSGPCGPCSEIYVDQGEEFFHSNEDYFGGDGDRFLEIWNLVFMQYEQKDGVRTLLPKPSIDTGMGLERVIALKEGRINNFDSSLFAPLMRKIEEISGHKYIPDDEKYRQEDNLKNNITDSISKKESFETKRLGNDEIVASFRVIADHARSVAFLLAQGVNFDKEGRGYVLRRILRRAVRHGYLLGLKKAFLYEVVGAVCDCMGKHYSYLCERKNAIQEQCRAEEDRFFETIENGMQLFNVELEKTLGKELLALENRFDKSLVNDIVTLGDDYFYKALKLPFEIYQEFYQGKISKDELKKAIEKQNGDVGSSNAKVPLFSGEVAFRLYDTFGFPLDLTQDMLREYGIKLDIASFESCMQEQKNRGRASWKGSGDALKNGDFNALVSEFGINKFVGYECMQIKSKILAILDSNFRRIDTLSSGSSGWIMLESTPFYPESGGPIGDKGWLKTSIDSKTKNIAKVLDTQKFFGINLSQVQALQSISVNDFIIANIDFTMRAEIAKHHSATHLLHYALKQILGSHISQAGSLVEEHRLRFDFSHPKALTNEEIEKIESLVNWQISMQNPQICETMELEKAKARGAMALFGEKYSENVRVISFGDSMELCGGIHVNNTAEIGSFYIVKESGVSSGVRRIEAVCGHAAYKHGKEALNLLKEAKEAIKNQDLLLGIHKLKNQLTDLKERSSKVKYNIKNLETQNINGITIIAMYLDSIESSEAKAIVDNAKNEYSKIAIMLITESNGKLSITAGIKDVAGLKAGEWVKLIAKELGGNGGGRDDFATAGVKDYVDSNQIKKALDLAKKIAMEKIK